MEKSEEANDLKEQLILVKGDISGIQEFIFNVKSEGAAKSLKAKSFFVKAISIISAHYLFGKFEVAENEREKYTISISGGNFFILVPNNDDKEKIFDEYKCETVSVLSKIGLNVVLTHVEINSKSDYGEELHELSTLNTVEKYKLFNCTDYEDVFIPFNDNPINFGILTLKGRQSYSLRSGVDGNLLIRDNSIRFLHHELILSNDPENTLFSLKDKPDVFFPTRQGNTLTFEEIAGNVGKSKKLGILKMDVDNLGAIFQNLTNSEEHKKLSEKFRYFFEDKVFELLRNRYNEFVYSIISGGDDCFFVGAWDAIIDMAFEINSQFTEFWRHDPFFKQNNKPTISAGLIIVNSKFPVVRFAEMAEEALLQAKMRYPTKNSISIFNTVIKWQDWEEIMNVKLQLESFLQKCAKSLLMNARKAVLKNENIEKIELSDFWELAYHLREVNKQGRSRELNDILNTYEKHLNQAIDDPDKDFRYRFFFPIAARMVELETR